MTLLGKMEKDKVKQMHGPFNESWTFERPQEAKLVTLLRRNEKPSLVGNHQRKILKPLENP